MADPRQHGPTPPDPAAPLPAAENGTRADFNLDTPASLPLSTLEEAPTIRLRQGWQSAASPEPGVLLSSPPSSLKLPAVGETTTPTRIGPYAVERVLNRGGMGIIYKAFDTRLKRPVALKMILSGVHADAATLARFRGEAEAVALLQHANIVQIYEVGEHDGLPFLAFEFVEGQNLQRVIAETPYPPAKSAVLVLTLARAVEFAHQRGIIHRDIKPGNILITPAGIPKITDFGLAKLKGASETFSRPGEVLGTPNYMAPEQAESDPHAVGPAADVYSLGAVLYELLTGQPPFQGTTPIEVLLRLRLNNPIPPRELRPKLPADLEMICLKCLRKDWHERYPSADRLADDLQRYLDGRPIVARPIGVVERAWKWSRRNPIVAGLGATLVASLFFWYAVVVYQWQNLNRVGQEVAEQRLELAAARVDLDEQRRELLLARAQAARAREQAEWISYLAQLGEAEREYATHTAVKARTLLEHCDAALRGWEWHYLRRRVEGSRATVSLQPGAVLAATVLPGDSEAALAMAEARIVRRDIQSGAERSTLKLNWDQGHEVLHLVHRAVFSPAGKLLAGGCVVRDKTTGTEVSFVAIWDAVDGRLMFSAPLPMTTSLKLAFRNDGKRLAVMTAHLRERRGQSGWHGGDIALFNLESAKEGWRTPLADEAPSFLDVAFLSDVDQIVLTRPDLPFTFLDARTGQVINEVKASAVRGSGVITDPQGTLIGVRDGQALHLFDRQGQLIAECNGHTGLIHHASFAASGKQAITCGTDHTVRIWDVSTRKPIAVLAGHTLPVTHAEISANGRRAVSFGMDGKLKFWDLDVVEPATLDTQTAREWTPSVEFGEGGKFLVSCSGDGRTIVWDTATRRPLRTHRRKGTIMTATLSPDSKRLAIGTSDPDDLTLIDPLSGKALQKLSPKQPVLTVSFSPDGKRLLVTGEEGMACIWDLDTETVLDRMAGHSSSVMAGAYHPTRDIVASGDASGRVWLWGSECQDRRAIRAHDSQISCLAFSPDGRWLATANSNREKSSLPAVIRLWDVASGKLVQELAGHDQSIWCLAWHPDGKRLASGSEDKTVKVWEPTQGHLLLTLKGHTDDVRCLAFSPDGRLLVSSNDDPFVRIWDATPMEK